jgi:hypothetical protein
MSILTDPLRHRDVKTNVAGSPCQVRINLVNSIPVQAFRNARGCVGKTYNRDPHRGTVENPRFIAPGLKEVTSI